MDKVEQHEEIAQGLIVVAERLEREARTLRSTAALLRHPHTK